MLLGDNEERFAEGGNQSILTLLNSTVVHEMNLLSVRKLAQFLQKEELPNFSVTRNGI